MEANIELRMDYNETEMKKALSFYILRVRDIRTYVFVVYPILFIAIILTLIFTDFALLPFVWFICGVIFFYFYYQRPIEGYLKGYKKIGSILYRFYEDKVFVVGENVQSECSWALFNKGYEIPSAFLLMDENESLYVLPKTYFSNPWQIEQMHSLLIAKIPSFKVYTP